VALNDDLKVEQASACFLLTSDSTAKIKTKQFKRKQAEACSTAGDDK
jgi:hypothetical protein